MSSLTVYYLRPILSDVPVKFRRFLISNFEVWLDTFFDVKTIELLKDGKVTKISGRVDLIILQIVPDIGLMNYPLFFEDESIPKVGYISMDSFSPCRYEGFRYFRKFNIDSYFSIDLNLGMRYKAVRDSLYYIPWFIPSDDLASEPIKQKKDFILLASHYRGTYPWRNKIFPLLKDQYPTSEIEHFSVFGKDFLERLSLAKYIPTDGGFGRIIVNKHLEIPASKSCLITQSTEAVLAMGFKDMENCIMADSLEELKPKIEYCETDDKKYTNIVENGFRLIKDYHTEKNRVQVIDWYKLNKAKDVNSKIVQPELFGTLQLVNKDSLTSTYVQGISDDKIITDEIDLLITEGKFQDALKKCDFLINEFNDYCPDFLIRKAIVCISLQDFPAAVKCVLQLFSVEMRNGKAEQPDPVEWGMLLLVFYLGRKRKIVARLLDFFDYNDDSFVNVIKAGIAVSLNRNDEASYFMNQSLQLGEQSFSSHSTVPQKFSEVLEWVKQIDLNAAFPSKELELLSEKQLPENKTVNGFFSKRTAIEKCYYVEYYCFNYSGEKSLLHLLKNRLRLLRDVAKVRLSKQRV